MTKQEEHISDKKELNVMGNFILAQGIRKMWHAFFRNTEMRNELLKPYLILFALCEIWIKK